MTNCQKCKIVYNTNEKVKEWVMEEINLKDWKTNTLYKGNLTEKNEVVQFFWETLS